MYNKNVQQECGELVDLRVSRRQSRREKEGGEKKKKIKSDGVALNTSIQVTLSDSLYITKILSAYHLIT